MSEPNGGGRRWRVLVPLGLGAVVALLFVLWPRPETGYEVVGTASPPPAAGGVSCAPLSDVDVDLVFEGAGRGTGVRAADVADGFRVRQLDDVGGFEASFVHEHAYQAQQVVEGGLSIAVSRSCGRAASNSVLAFAEASRRYDRAADELAAVRRQVRADPDDPELEERLDRAVATEARAERARDEAFERAEARGRLGLAASSRAFLRLERPRRVELGSELPERVAFVLIVALGTVLLVAVIRGLRRSIDEGAVLVDPA